MNSKNKHRLVFIDVARALAVVTALLAHCMITFKLWPQLSKEQAFILTFVTHYATPSFILLFGIMLEIVYYPKILREGIRPVRSRLLQRSLICYLAYVATAIVGIIVGRLSISKGLAACLFLRHTHFNNILKFWILALILAIPLLILRRRKSLFFTFLIGMSPWLLIPFLQFIPWPERSNVLSGLTTFLFGRPTGISPYSLFHSIPLIVIGMLLGRTLSIGIERQSFVLFYRTIGWTLMISVGITLIVSYQLTPETLLLGFQKKLRYQHHIGYYILGLAEALIGLLILSWLIPPKTRYDRRFSTLLFLGRSSLLAYVLGNLILIFWPKLWRLAPSIGFLYSALLLGLVMCIAILIERMLFRRRAMDRALPQTERLVNEV